MNAKLGFAGILSRKFIHSKLTPLIAVFSIVVGLFSIWLTPKEEEPQISVPMIDIEIGYPGHEAKDVERKVTEVVERSVWGLEGVEYVYSASQPHGTLVTVRFKVGEPIEPSLVKIHHQMLTVRNDLPKDIIGPRVSSYTIDDVPFLTLTFSSNARNDYELRNAVTPLARELSSTSDLGKIEVIGGQKRAIRIIADPQKLHTYGVSLIELAKAIQDNDSRSFSGKNWASDRVLDVEVGGRYRSADDVSHVSIGQRAGRIIRVSDVAVVADGPEQRVVASRLLDKEQASQSRNAVSIVFSKRKGTDVVRLSRELISRAKIFSKTLPSDITMVQVRDYGSTAADKSKELIEHLLLATFSVSVLIAIFMGIRASLVVATAIPVTLALTLAIYYFMGYTLNRVTLFALIFSIGILVDDAIVVVENIERHLKQNPTLGLTRATILAVNEVGNPTILATFTVIASILPMAFVRGLMGPYMKPIPVGASLAMILSLFVAFIVTPWASVRLLKNSEGHEGEASSSKLDLYYQKVMEWLFSSQKHSLKFAGVIGLLFILSIGFVYTKAVKVKMLPFDNKNEFQVLLDFPSSTPLDAALEKSQYLAQKLLEDYDIEKVQVFSGEPAPFSFSGMVKHTFLRHSDYMTDLHVVLKDKEHRKASSHKIIERVRPMIAQFSSLNEVHSKVLEIPPGPPVMATLVAEIYGPTDEVRKQTALEVEKVFKNEPSVVDLDTSMRLKRDRIRYPFDYNKAAFVGLSAALVSQTGFGLFQENSVGVLEDVSHPEDINVNLSVANAVRSSKDPFFGQVAPSFESGVAQIKSVLGDPVALTSEVRMRKNLKPVNYVTAETAGAEEAPVYSIMKIQPQIKFPVQTSEVPWDTSSPVVKWDGEWFITYEVFRDLGGAFLAVMILIYVLVVGWFRSFTIPLIIMAPIPISLIGILPGHYLANAYFTATSMIGFIAGAGIIVRNSIILVDFIEEQLKEGKELKHAVVMAGVLRFRPMLLTAAAVVVGSSVMLFDSIFQGLAVSLMFGEIAATLLSRFAVPVMYYWFVGKSRIRELTIKEEMI